MPFLVLSSFCKYLYHCLQHHLPPASEGYVDGGRYMLESCWKDHGAYVAEDVIYYCQRSPSIMC